MTAEDASGEAPYVGRGGLKLRHALDVFGVDVAGLRCADFGCNVGGFTDCLLRAGAAHVIAVDTGYGVLDYRLRIDPRVTVMERTSALHAPAPAAGERVDLVAIDLGWTPQRLAVPAAMAWLRDGAGGRVVSLVKPHYEAGKLGGAGLLKGGVLDPADAERIARETLDELAGRGVRVLGVTRSPIAGGAGKRKGAAKGNAEWLALLSKE